MTPIKELIPLCPVCSVQISANDEFCRRCGCHLLLLFKIVKTAEELKGEGRLQESRALFRSAQEYL